MKLEGPQAPLQAYYRADDGFLADGSACAVSPIVSSHLLAAYGMSLDDREEEAGSAS